MQGVWLAKSEEHAALDPRVMILSPILGVEIAKKERERDLVHLRAREEGKAALLVRGRQELGFRCA